MRSLARKITGALICLICFVLLARASFYRDPGSVFFDESRAYEKEYSQHRIKEVEHFVASFDTSNKEPAEPHPKRPSGPDLCISIASVKRNDMQYIETTIGSILEGLTANERADLHLTLLIAEPDPSEHPGWHKEWLHLAVDELYNYNISVEERDRLRILQQTTAYAEKGVYDYIYGLEHCYAKETPFIGMLEDDILLADGWLVRTLQSLARLPTPVDEESSWLFLRLFNQERSTGWATRSVGGNNEAVIIVSIGLIISTFTYLVHRKWQRARTNIDIETIVVVVLLLNPALVILFFQCGKASMLPPSPGVVREPFGCCSQAMIFPRSVVPSIVMFLQKEKQGQIDTLLDDLAQEANLSRYALYPVQAQHIGLQSSRMTEEREAKAIWSMAYERLDPVALRRDHLQMARTRYHSL